MLQINVVTLFPEALAPMLAASIPGRATAAGRVASAGVTVRGARIISSVPTDIVTFTHRAV